MVEVMVLGAAVDSCELCGGGWFDFSDGEFAELARHAGPADEIRPPSFTNLDCVDCSVSLQRQPYLGTGPELLRCPECMGAFLSTDDIRTLSRFHKQTGVENPGWWSRFWAWAHR